MKNVLINVMKFGGKLISKSWKKINLKNGFQYFCVQVILIDSAYRKDKNYYPKVLLEKYNSIIIETKMSNFDNDIEIYSDESYNVDSDREYSDDTGDSDKENSNGKIQMKKIKCINLLLEKVIKIWWIYF